MQLREIQIWGFGALANVRMRGLSTGLNVLHGPNEYGKTTLLEFVRRLLFGFPPRTTKANPYPSLYSDRYGGQLVCEMADGRLLTVTRTAGKGGGTLTVATQHGETVGEAEFAASLGYVSSNLYQNVFSIGLQELYEVDVMNLDEVKNRVYGAGLGGVSVSALHERFEKRAGERYTKGGQKQRIKQLAADIGGLNRTLQVQRGQLAQYDGMKVHRDQLQQDADALSARLPRMQAELENLKTRQHLFPTFSRMQEAERESRQMGDLPDIPDAALMELDERLRAVESLESRLEQDREQLRLRQAAYDRVRYDPAIIQCGPEVRWLSQNLAGYRATLRDLPLVERELLEATTLSAREVAILGEGWTADQVRAFSLTTAKNDALEQAAARLGECSSSLSTWQQKLEMHRDHVRASQRRPGFSGSFRIVGLGLAVLAGVACVLALLDGHVPIAVLTGVTAALIAVASLRIPTATSDLNDPATLEIESEVKLRQEALEQSTAGWRAALESAALPASLSSAAKDEFLRRIDRLGVELRHINSLESQADRLRQSKGAVEERYAQVAAALRESPTSGDMASQIEELSDRLENTAAEKVRKDTLEEDIQQRADEIRLLEEHKVAESSRLADYLHAWHVASEEEFRERYARSVRQRELRRVRGENLKLIEDEVGTGENCDEFLRSLAATTLDNIRLARAELEQKVHHMQEEITSMASEMGALDTKLQTLVSTDDLVLNETELETLKQQLQDAYREWLTARIALKVIDAAVSRYEEERQPAVIRLAQTTFTTMTNSRYEKLLKPLDSDELQLRDVSGTQRTVGSLSRGTREQLYLAMRLGLIEQYEQSAEPLPVIMDDIIVNFDDTRGPLAVQALADFARDRQVIVMTCHDSTRQLYRDAGANELTIERNDTPT